jgi:integrase
MSVYLIERKSPITGKTSFRLDFSINGTKHTETLKFKIEKNDPDKKQKLQLAKRIRAQKELEISSGEYGYITKQMKSASFLVYFQSFIDNYKNKDIRMYKYALAKLRILLNNKDVAFNKININLVEDFKEYLVNGAGLRGETPYDYFARFRRVLTKSYRDGYLNADFIQNIKSISISRKNVFQKDVLNHDELKTLFLTECGNQRTKSAFLFACYTGLGMAEIRELTWANIQKNRVRIPRAKTGMLINNAIPDFVLNFLGVRSAYDDRIFHELPSDTAVWKTLGNWIKKATINKHISFYCARHTFAANLLIGGANLKTVADCLAHSNIQHTVKYLVYVSALKDEATMKMPDPTQ